MSLNNLDQLYRQVIMDHYKNPRNRGELRADDMLKVNMNNPTCGDTIQLQMQVEGEEIVDAKFLGEGCSISLSSADMMAEVVKGKSVEDAMQLSEIFSKMMLGKDYDQENYDLEDVEALQGVSKFPARIKCATLAWKAMEKGLKEKRSDE